MSPTMQCLVALAVGAVAICSLLYFWRREEIASDKRLAARLLEIDHQHALWMDESWERNKRWEQEDREWRKNHRATMQALAVLERRFQEGTLLG